MQQIPISMAGGGYMRASTVLGVPILILVFAYLNGSLGGRNGQDATPQGPEAERPPTLHEKGVVNNLAFGCLSREEHESFINLVVSKDKEAIGKFIDTRLASGTCEEIEEGAEVLVEQVTFSNNFCVRRTGDLNCLWVSRGQVRKADAQLAK
jgi:hypothetical protein